MGDVTPGAFMLDTHVVLWMLTDPDHLSPGVRALVSNRTNRLSVSAASAWEIATKHRLGRLPGADALVRAYPHHLSRVEIETRDITADHALLAGGLDWEHRDPFDRMIAAQCMLEALPLVTRDAAFGGLGGIRLVW